jgi:hypothetical protein
MLVLNIESDYSSWELVNWNDFENFGMMSHSIERFWRWIWLVNDLVNFIKNTDGWVRMRYHSNFTSTPTIPNMGKGLTRNLCALVWVPSEQASSGLGRGLPLQQTQRYDMTWNEVNVRPKPCAVPGLTAVFTGRPSSWGEVPILEYVNERLGLVVRVLRTINQGQLPLTNYCNCCGTSVQPLQS